jgi:hypothetical protein
MDGQERTDRGGEHRHKLLEQSEPASLLYMPWILATPARYAKLLRQPISMAKCQHIKDNGQECKNPAVKGMRFCWRPAHCGTAPFQARVRNFFSSNWKVFVLGTVVTIAVGGVYFAIQENEARHGVLVGRLLGRKTTLKEPSILLGNARIGVVEGVSNLFIDSDGAPLLSLRIDDKGYLKTSVALRNATGALMAEIRDNEWKVRAPEIYDRNFNKQVLEVRDANGDVALQIVDYGDTILVRGTLYCRNGASLRLDTLPTGQGEITIITPDDPPPPPFHLNPICDYPSDTHFGDCPRTPRFTKRQIKAFKFHASNGLTCPGWAENRSR